MTDRDTSLRRALGLPQLLAIGVNMCIGGSIFLIGADVYRAAGAWSLVLAAMVGLFALVMGLVIAELASRFEGTGGPYLYARTAFGPFAGFQVAWMMWFTRVLAQASLTNGVMTSVAYFRGVPLSWLESAAGIVVLTLAVALVHLRGVAQGARVISFFTIAKLLPLAAVLVLGAGMIGPVAFGPPPAPGNMATTALLLLFTFSGYEVIPVTAGESRNPRRDAPIATIVSILVMVGVWLALQLVLMSTVAGLGAEPRPVAAAAAVLGGDRLALFVTIGAIVSATGTCFGTMLVASRSLYVVADDGGLPRWFAQLDPATGAPSRAILFSTGLILVLALSGSFVFLAAAAALPRLIVFAVSLGALFRLRQADRAGGKALSGFRMPFAPVLGPAAMLAMLAVLPGASSAQLLTVVAGLGMGAILYWFGRRAVA